MILYFTSLLVVACLIAALYYIVSQEPTRTKTFLMLANLFPNCVLYWLVNAAFARMSTSQEYEHIAVPDQTAMDLLKWLREN
jgi:hypothetical protein